MELIVTKPFFCTNKEVLHDSDDGKELHGSLEKPVPVGDTREGHYVPWEYEEIGRQVPAFHRCVQQLFEDSVKSPTVSVDRIVVRDTGGRHHVFYFDVSVPMNAGRAKFEQAWKDYQAGKPVDARTKAILEKAIAIQKKNSRIVEL